MNKKGSMIQSTLIGIIIVLLSAAIIFFFLKALPYKEQVDIEACHNSVVLRNNALVRGEGGLPEIPLNCKTQEVEIKTTNEDSIKREIANQMYTCWWMLGEGKMKFLTDSLSKEYGIPIGEKGIPFTHNVKSSCVICSNIKFSDKLKEKNLQLDMASYMEQTKVPSRNITYLQYFTEQDDAVLPTDVDAPAITTDKDYIVLFMNIEGDSFWEVLKRDAATLGIIGGITSMSFGGKTIIGGAAKTILKHPIIAAIVITAVLGLQFTETQINSAVVGQRCNEEKKGCSQIMLIPMEAANLSGVCDNIESIP